MVRAPLRSETIARRALLAVRRELEAYVRADPGFLEAMQPMEVPAGAPAVVRSMARAGEAHGVGPMAAVAGAVAEVVGRRVAEERGQAIVENGGDLWARVDHPLRVGIYAGEESPFGDRLHVVVDARRGLGVCCSSGTVGHSISRGRADAVLALHPDAAVADAAATAYANCIREPGDVAFAVEQATADPHLLGLVACCGDRIGVAGPLRLLRSHDPDPEPFPTTVSPSESRS
jgi:ApbE superfamily uncharacterized protein (UPF0280 family)